MIEYNFPTEDKFLLIKLNNENKITFGEFLINVNNSLFTISIYYDNLYRDKNDKTLLFVDYNKQFTFRCSLNYFISCLDNKQDIIIDNYIIKFKSINTHIIKLVGLLIIEYNKKFIRPTFTHKLYSKF